MNYIVLNIFKIEKARQYLADDDDDYYDYYGLL